MKSVSRNASHCIVNVDGVCNLKQVFKKWQIQHPFFYFWKKWNLRIALKTSFFQFTDLLCQLRITSTDNSFQVVNPYFMITHCIKFRVWILTMLNVSNFWEKLSSQIILPNCFTSSNKLYTIFILNCKYEIE